MILEQMCHPSGPVFYVSPQLREAGVPHCFSTRIGGRSPAPFDSLNLGNPGGEVLDDRARIHENYRILQSASGMDGRERCWLHQIHSPVFVRVGSDQPRDNSAKGDALTTNDSAFVLSVRVADCCPVLLACDDGKCVAAIHSGWRGTAAGTSSIVLSELMWMSGAASAKNFLAAIGPCIGFEAFEVGPEVLAEFERVHGKDAPIRKRSDGKGYANIRESIRLDLLRAGIPARNIDTTERCTHRDGDQFFSHRREAGVTGRMAAMIAAK